ncbi:MAG: hypothetical protein LIO71_09920 [Ruminococcus sp.]|nr:hypothetical protein [Ruminococcus sp.]
MKSLKSKQNIAILMLTGIICLIIVGYALLTAYNTKISRSSAVQSSSSSVSQSSASSFYETLTLASSYSYNHLDFDNPFNNSKFSAVANGGTKERTIESTGTNSSSEQYLVGSECYIYTKLQIVGFEAPPLSDDTDLNNILGTDFKVTFFIDGNEITGSNITGDEGTACWDRFCYWYSSKTEHTAKCTLESDGTFYVAVRTMLDRCGAGVGNHTIRVEYNGQTLDTFIITVKNYTDLTFNSDIIGNTSGTFFTGVYASSIWGYENGFTFTPTYNHPGKETYDVIVDDYAEVSLGDTITPELIQQHDFDTTNNAGEHYSSLNTSYDLKVVLLYPEYNYSYAESDLVRLDGNGWYFCNKDDTITMPEYSDRTNYTMYCKFNEQSHTIPTDSSCLTEDGHYVVKEIFFNEWTPKGQFWIVRYHYYKVQTASVDTVTTDKQQENGLDLSKLNKLDNDDLSGFIGGFDYIYVENAKVYTYVALTVKAGDESKLEKQLGNVTAKFTIKDENGNTLVDENNGIKCEVFDDDYTSYQDTTNVLKEDDGTYTVLLSLGWVTPEVDDDSMTVNVTIELDGDLSGIDNPYKDIPLKITIYDTDFIDEYKNIEEKCGVELSDSTLFDFENATKEIFNDFGVGSVSMVNNFESSKTGQVLYDDDYTNKTYIKNKNDISGSNWTFFWTDSNDSEMYIDANDKRTLIEVDKYTNKILPGDEVLSYLGSINTHRLTHPERYTCDRKVIILYPEYDYNMAFGDFVVVDKEIEQEVGKLYTFKMYSTQNITLSSSKYYHTIPLWWNESEYTIIEIVFNDWTPIGQTHWIETVTYTNVDKDGSILDDWYITRNVE